MKCVAQIAAPAQTAIRKCQPSRGMPQVRVAWRNSPIVTAEPMMHITAAIRTIEIRCSMNKQLTTRTHRPPDLVERPDYLLRVNARF